MVDGVLWRAEAGGGMQSFCCRSWMAWLTVDVLHVWIYQPFDLRLVIPLSLVFLTCGIRDINNVYFVELFFL